MVTELLNTLVTSEKYNPDEPDGWLDGEPYYLLNPKLHKESLMIDYGLHFVRYDTERDLNMFTLV